MHSQYYRKKSNIRRTKSQNLNDSHLVLRLSFPNPLKPGEDEDVVGAAPTGDAPTTSEWSTILLPTKVRLILEVLRYYLLTSWMQCLTVDEIATYEINLWFKHVDPDID